MGRRSKISGKRGEDFGFYWEFTSIPHYYPDDQLIILALMFQSNITPLTIGFDIGRQVFDR